MATDGVPRPVRNWRIVADLLSKEDDPAKIEDLIAELNAALERQELMNCKIESTLSGSNPVPGARGKF